MPVFSGRERETKTKTDAICLEGGGGYKSDTARHAVAKRQWKRALDCSFLSFMCSRLAGRRFTTHRRSQQQLQIQGWEQKRRRLLGRSSAALAPNSG